MNTIESAWQTLLDMGVSEETLQTVTDIKRLQYASNARYFI